MKSLRLSLLLCSALGLWAPGAFSQTSTVPALLSYQGLLSDSAGTLIGAASPVNRTVQFRLYNASTGGTPIWAESQVVTISAGEFSVLIGNGAGISGISGPSAPAALPFKSLADAVNSSASASLFLGLTVDDAIAATTDVEVSPRQQLVSGMFALRAKVAETVATGAITSGMIADSQVSTNALQTSAVTTVKLADSAITSAKIADGSVLAADLASSAVTASKIDANSVGLWSVTGANVYRPSGNVGIGTATPGYPLSFPASLGDKISLWGGQSGAHLGIGIQPNALQIFGANVNDDVVFGYGSSFALTEVMRVKGNGNVGIGTSAPGGLLHINTNVNKSLNPIIISNDVASWGTVHLFNNFKYITTTSAALDGNFKPFMVGAGGMAIGYEPPGYGSAHAMYVKGYVGIQNANPGAPLHVSDQTYNESNWEAIMDIYGPRDLTNPYLGGNFGLIVDSSIRAAAYVVNSDKRLKKGVHRSDSASDMKSLLGIEVSNYQFIDTHRHGAERQKKVIAQQVESVYPQAITKSKGVLPDIYKAAEIRGQWIHLETNLKLGERVRLVSPQHDETVEVLELAQGSFRTDFPQKSGKVLVYGREVDDLRSVDYDALSVLNISATQELHRELDQERRQNASLKSKLSSVEDRLDALEKRIQASK